MKPDKEMNAADILTELKNRANAENVRGMARFGINPLNNLGISMPVLRKLGKAIGINHRLAQDLWNSGIHEARILAAMIDDPDEVTDIQMETWVRDFDSWDICDQVISNLFDKTPFACSKAIEWSARKEEFIKRAGFVMMAELAVHDKKASDDKFIRFFSLIIREAGDDRNFVKKAVNWALRQIGKRNLRLNALARATALKIRKSDSASAKWIANNALRELESETVIGRLSG